MRPRLLVVDDEPDMLAIVAAFLDGLGDVAVASDAEAAWRALEQGPCDLLITDIRMPGASGIALVGRVRLAWPALPIIVISGFEHDAAVDAFRWLAKPFRRVELRDAVVAALHR